jgi:alpha-N-arabinofuranosidase
VERTVEDIKEISFLQKIDPGKIWIRIEADKEFYRFSYAMDNENFFSMCKASTRLLCAEVSGRCFTGMTMGLYASCRTKTSAVAWYSSMILYGKQ